jgi:geranylgeranyl diphosphate synthase type II
MKTLDELQRIIRESILSINLNREPVQLYEPISYTLNLGGKRLRPALCLLACDMVSGNMNDALQAAIGIEVFHNFTLLHDDIMDKAPIRRGKPTVYKKWDENTAILSGDTMMALAYEYIMKAPEPSLTKVFSVFNQTAIEVCEGQQYDMNFENRQDVSIGEYLEMIRLKTAVLVAASLQIGAIIGKADQKTAELLYKFGENIGLAFQLKDDLLDVFSDVEKFGKTSGGDIVSNKKTFLYLKAFELANPEQSEQLKALFVTESNISSEEKITKVKSIYQALNIKQETEKQIDFYYRKAKENLSQIDLKEAKKKELVAFAQILKSRDR